MKGWCLTIAVLVLAGAYGDGTEPTLTEPATTAASTERRREPLFDSGDISPGTADVVKVDNA